MNYNLFIYTKIDVINLFNIDKETVAFIVDCYKQSNDEFAYLGKIYYISDVQEFYIFTNEKQLK